MDDKLDSSTPNGRPDTIYHYTTVRGFQGIITSKQLWLSHASFMNDYMEHTWLLQKADEHLKALGMEANNEHTESLRALVSSLDILEMHPYIACFSQEPDLLSQWRAYTNDGAGFAIGYSTDAIESECRQYNNCGIRLWPVDYEQTSQDMRLAKAIQHYVDCEKQNGPARVDDVFHTCGKIWTIAAICKNPGFREEKECRIVMMPLTKPEEGTGRMIADVGVSEIRFRLSGNCIIPYYVLEFPQKAVTEIRLGPKNYARDFKGPLLALLRKNGFAADKIKLVNSEVTYR